MAGPGHDAENLDSLVPVPQRFAQTSLLLANFVAGIAILGLAGMLTDLARGFGVSIATAGILVTAGGVVLCLGSPLMVWATSRVDRRLLLAGALALVGVTQLASALAPSYAVLLALRVVGMAFAALITPQAASTVALLVSERERAAAIVYVFLGFSLAIAAGLPLIAFLSAHVGWQWTFALIGAAALGNAVLLLIALPKGLRGLPLALRNLFDLLRNRRIELLLLISMASVSAQFVIFTYLAPLITRLTGASTSVIALFFSLLGIMGVVGNVIATRLVGPLKPFGTSLVALLTILLGFSVWGGGAGCVGGRGGGVVFWGLGFTAINSMQQARLITSAPDFSSAAVALNTSSVYIGQAIGSALGGFLLAHDLPRALGYAAVAFMLAALGFLMLTRDGPVTR